MIVYATGFHATEYLFPMTITGRDGKTIEETVGRRRRPRLPRLAWCPASRTCGRSTGRTPTVGSGRASFHELVALYALQCIERLILDDKREIEVKEDAYWRYNELVDERNARKVWSDPRAHNYYWTEHGRSAMMCPFYSREFWHLLRHPNFEELEYPLTGDGGYRGGGRQHPALNFSDSPSIVDVLRGEVGRRGNLRGPRRFSVAMSAEKSSLE